MDHIGRFQGVLSIRTLVATLSTAVVVSCGGITPTAVSSVPTEVEARLLLSQMVDAAHKQDFALLCSFGDANCQEMLSSAGMEVPTLPPTVAGMRVIESTATTHGGLVLQLCGIDTKGASYASEMLIFKLSSGLKAIQPVYWSRMRIPEGNTVGANQPLALPGCP